MSAIRRLSTIGSVVVTLLFTGARQGVTGESTTWNTYQDQNCGIEFKYPASLLLEIFSADDRCALSVDAGAIELEVKEMDRFYRQGLVASGMEISSRGFAIYIAGLHCAADGPDGSTYCTDAVRQSAFETPQGLQGHEFYLTKVEESYGEEGPRIEEKTTIGPVFALDISDAGTIRIFLATSRMRAEPLPTDVAMMKAMVDSVRISGKARRSTPQVIELERLIPCPPTCVVYPPLPWPPSGNQNEGSRGAR